MLKAYCRPDRPHLRGSGNRSLKPTCGLVWAGEGFCAIAQSGGMAFLKVIDPVVFFMVPTFQQKRIARPLQRIRT